jgi:MoaA/NifB/PqqE/SkfB family radical SAM enzyme
MKQQNNVNRLLNQAIRSMFRDAFYISLKNLKLAWFLFETINRQWKAERVRNKLERQGIHIPPFMIISITNRCNLACKGCYAQLQHRSQVGEISISKLRAIIEEGKELGISIVLLAGGEPLVRPEILEITKDHPELIFALFTNGLLSNEKLVKQFKAQKHVVPIISLEGLETQTDERRGNGVYEQGQQVMGRFKHNGIFYGVSITMTRINFAIVTGRQFIQGLINQGCKLFFFVEYIPVQTGTEDLILLGDQRQIIIDLMDEFRAKYPGLFIAFPGDEEQFGGCLAAGRGFIHISANGELEPCPFAPYTDTNLQDIPLKEALQSKLLEMIRENHGELKETQGGCALWQKREWLNSITIESKCRTN